MVKKNITSTLLNDCGSEQLYTSCGYSYCLRVVGRKPTISIASCSRSKSCFRSSPSTVKQSCWCVGWKQQQRDRGGEEDRKVRHQHHRGFHKKRQLYEKAVCMPGLNKPLVPAQETIKIKKILNLF